MRKIILSVITAVALLFIGSCHHENNKQANAPKIVTATLRSTPTLLYYSGSVNPITVYNVTSPADGNVKQLFVQIGQKITKGQTLLVISSSKLQDDYRTALTNFLKAKQDYLTAVVNFQGTQELQKAQIIAQQEYMNDKNQYDSAALAYLDAKFTLEQTIQQIPGASKQLENLSLDDTNALSKILKIRYDQLPIIAQTSGLILPPQKGSDSDSGGSSSSDGDSGDGSSKTLQVGSAIKQGQGLFSIADVSGISTTIQVSEIAIDNIKMGLPVILTIEALPDVVFNGSVQSIGAQASSASDGSGGGLATFPVTVVVPKITPQQEKLIREGMSAKVQITINNPPQIMIPISAVYQKNGLSTVALVDPKTKKTTEVPVETGATTVDEVAITNGLRPGDQVMVP